MEKSMRKKADSEFLCLFMLNECVGKRLACQDVCQEDERMGSKGIGADRFELHCQGMLMVEREVLAALFFSLLCERITVPSRV